MNWPVMYSLASGARRCWDVAVSLWPIAASRKRSVSRLIVHAPIRGILRGGPVFKLNYRQQSYPFLRVVLRVYTRFNRQRPLFQREEAKETPVMEMRGETRGVIGDRDESSRRRVPYKMHLDSLVGTVFIATYSSPIYPSRIPC